MSTVRLHLGFIAISLALVVVATVALVVTAHGSSEPAGGQIRLLIGAATGLALVVLANFVILDERSL